MDENKSKALAAALSQIEKQCGKGSIMRMGDTDIGADIQSVSTGSLGLDIALGIDSLRLVHRLHALEPVVLRDNAHGVTGGETIGVETPPGAMQFTRIISCAYWSAAERVRFTTPALAAQ